MEKKPLPKNFEMDKERTIVKKQHCHKDASGRMICED